MTDQLAATGAAVTTRPRLPVPTRTRWQPLRLGLTNCYRYDHQEFHFEDGRLLLRGNNGTGKSRVVALTLPFLLDGETAPYRVEPDGDTAKRMEWNLLLGTHDDRLGYTWLEFGRRDEDGTDRYVTIGAGLRALAGRGAPTTWFFVTDRRVGDELSLVAEAGQALVRERLREAIGERGSVVDTATEHRRAVDAALFGLGEARYAALIELLIQLRRPQLSRQLDEAKLSDALSEALPPLDPGVVADVAEAFRRLDDDRDEVDGFRAALAATDTFLDHYRSYAAVAVRRRARDLTASNSRYEKVRGLLSDEEATRDEQQERVAALGRRLDELDQAITGGRAAVDVLVRSPEMDLARELDAARKRVSELRSLVEERTQDLSQADAALARHTDEHAEAEEAVTRSRGDVEAGLEQGAVAAETLGQFPAHAAALGTLGPVDDAGTALPEPDEARGELEALLGRLTERLGHLRDLERDVADAQAALDGRRRDLATAEQDHDRAADTARSADEAVTAARDELIDAYRRWAEDAAELEPAPAGLIAEELAGDLTDGPGPVTTAVSEALQQAHGRLARAGAELDGERQTLEAELAEVRAERDAVAAGRHDPPPPHPGRDHAGRTTRSGAPLWQLVDWVDGIAEDARDGYEAALHAAGLLDAWVTPDGRILDVDDALLLASEGVASGQAGLSDVLHPVNNAPIPVEVIGAVLASIGGEARVGGVWVAADGRYALGPLAGRAVVRPATHVGHAAREAARRERLRQLEQQIRELEDTAAALETRAEQLDAAEQRLATYRRAAPTEEALSRALVLAARAHQDVHDIGQRVAAASEAVRVARGRVDEATSGRDEAASDLGLTGWLERLDELRDAVGEYRTALAGLWPLLSAHQQVLARLARATRDRDLAATAHATAEERASEARRAAHEAEARSQALQESIGAEVQQFQARLEAARAALRDLEEEHEQVRSAQGEAEIAARVAVQRIEDLTADLERVTDERAAAVERFRHAVVAGLATIADAALEDERAPSDGTWAPDPAVRTARRIDQALNDVASDDEAWRRVAGRVFADFQELEHALLPHGIQPSATHDDELFVVRAPFQGADHAIDRLRAMLADELTTRQTLLDARERELLENHLVGEVATQLHELIRTGETLVAEMNAEIEQRPTSTGMRLRFAWRPREDGPAAFADARRRLLAADHVWSSDDRAALGGFLQERIREVRAADDTGTWQEHLSRALDYRRWHLFVVERQQDGTWVRLTRRTHGTGSGGEKALALTIPQFAAAAAHYRSAHAEAPRLIALDEAFVGIDSDMRAKCMDLLTSFDLDVVMTSEREWACYPTVPAIAIAQLSTRPGIDAVGVHRWVWNGRQKLAVRNEPVDGAADQSARDGPA